MGQQSNEHLVLLNGMRAVLKEELDRTEKRLGDRIGGVERQFSDLRNEVSGLEKRVEDVERRMDERVEKAVGRISGTNQLRRPRPIEPDNNRDARYWKARSSLRMWPIRGDGEQMMGDLQKFLAMKLRLGEDVIADAEDCLIRRIPKGPNSKIEDEVSVEFSSVELRDVVKSAAYNLAQERNAGIRLEVAHHLMSNFKALNRASYRLKQKFSACKRNVRYDDERLDLVLDFKPSEKSGRKRLRPDQAREMNKSEGEAEEMSAVDVSEMLEASDNEDDTLTGANNDGQDT